MTAPSPQKTGSFPDSLVPQLTPPFPAKWAWITFAIVLLAFTYSCVKRTIHIDDAWLSELSYFLSKEGVLRSEAFRGWEKSGEHVFFTHQLLVRMGALFTTLFGYGVYQMKSVGLFYLTALIFLWATMLRRMKASTGFVGLFLALLLINCRIFEAGFMFRPEIAVALFISATYFLLIEYKQTSKIRFVVFSGVTCALAIGHHLNGVICLAAGSMLLLSWKNWKFAPIFIGLGSLGFGAYLIDVRSIEDLNTLYAQFHNAQSLTLDHFNKWHYVINLASEHRRLFATPAEIAQSLMLIAVAAFCFKTIRARYRDMLIFSGTLIFILALIAQTKTPKYMILYIPFLIFFIAAGFCEGFQVRKKLFATLLVAYICCQAIGNKDVLFHKENRYPFFVKVTEGMPRGTRILMPFEMSFYGIERLSIRPHSAFLIANLQKGQTLPVPPFTEFLERDKIEAIIFDRESYKEFDVTHNGLPGFRLVESNPALQLYYYTRN